MTLHLIYTLALRQFFTLPAVLDSSLNLGALVMLIDLVLVPVVSLFTKKPDAEKVDAIFACYDRTITVHVSSVLPDEEGKPAAQKTEDVSSGS